MGTKFTVFDNGANPDRANADWSNVRQELSAVVYVSSGAGTPTPGTSWAGGEGVLTLTPSLGSCPGDCGDVGWAGAIPERFFSCQPARSLC